MLVGLPTGLRCCFVSKDNYSHFKKKNMQIAEVSRSLSYAWSLKRGMQPKTIVNVLILTMGKLSRFYYLGIDKTSI